MKKWLRGEEDNDIESNIYIVCTKYCKNIGGIHLKIPTISFYIGET